eukprot:scaffold10472_cov126-Cylindrotheca_fusiformis.AAC.7
MTGIADLYLYLNRPNKDRRKRLLAHFMTKEETNRFVVLSWKRTGSNLLCGMLHFHPEICMHNELFNPIDIFTYHPEILRKAEGDGQWTVQVRDLYPQDFLEYIWNPKTIARICPRKHAASAGKVCKAVGFKSFPEHWIDTRNEDVWRESLLEDLRVKKIILRRKDELAVYVSMQRADLTGLYMTHSYPQDLKIKVDPAAFQAFLNNYRHTFCKKYKSPISKRDTFWIDYEQLVDEDKFEQEILPKLWKFLGVDPTVQVRRLRETVKQADPNEDLSKVISNYEELEFCFRHSDVLHFAARRANEEKISKAEGNVKSERNGSTPVPPELNLRTWSILLPICSRPRASRAKVFAKENDEAKQVFNSNRFTELAVTSQHFHDIEAVDEKNHWEMLQTFCSTLNATSTTKQLALTECIVGIDDDDKLFQNPNAKDRIRAMIPAKVVFVNISFKMYGHVCKIWNFLASKAQNDFVVLLGDDIKLLSEGWQERIVAKFSEISRKEGLPFGAACVAMNDLAFPGFPTFPVLHRWHIQNFGSLLPKQFSNQGGE